jgi:hypothetical protein
LLDTQGLFRALLPRLRNFIAGSTWGQANITQAERGFYTWVTRECPRVPIVTEGDETPLFGGGSRLDKLQTQV